MDFKQFASLLRRRWLTVVLLVVVALGLSTAYSLAATKQYESTTKIFVSAAGSTGTGDDTYAGALFTASRMKSYADLATSTDLLEQVVDELGLPVTVEELAGQITATVVPETFRLVLSVRDPDPKTAQNIARVTADRLVDYLTLLETPISTTGDPQPQINATVTDPADFDDAAVSPRTGLNLVIAGVLGLVLGAALAVAREVLDRTVGSVEQVETMTKAPVLASVSFDQSIRKSPVLTDLGGFAPRTEAFRVLRTNLQFLDLDQRPRSIVITSAVPGEGKTITSTNLAVALAQAGRRVLLVDGDLRRPRVASVLGLDAAVGLTTVLVGSTELKEAIQVHEPSGLHLLSSGAKPPNPTEILQSRVTKDLVLELQDLYDMVIIDAPPLLPVADASVLATIADGAIVVTRHGHTSREQLEAAVSRLDRVGARLFGVVLNMVRRRAGADPYHYYYSDDAPASGSRKR